jgi:NAD-dependent protein deacetylase/lipoamidase
MTSLDADIRAVGALVRGANRIAVLTGAGISTESGIPDFRGPQGVWTKNPAAEKLSTLQHYMNDPDVRRRAWQQRLQHEAWKAQPNAGHAALVDLERSGKLVALLTQNIDGLHQKAGSNPALVVEIHGTVHEVVCMSCGDRGPMSAALERVRSGEEDPSCRACSGILKSATISFGQNLVEEDLRRAERAALNCDLMLAIGTSLGVYPIAGVVPLAKRARAHIVIVNGTPTEMDGLADYVLRGKIGEILPSIVAEAEGTVGA